MAESEEEPKEPLNESERRELKSWLKAQPSENNDHDTTLPVEHQVQKEYTGMGMALCHSPLFQLPTGNGPMSL